MSLFNRTTMKPGEFRRMIQDIPEVTPGHRDRVQRQLAALYRYAQEKSPDPRTKNAAGIWLQGESALSCRGVNGYPKAFSVPNHWLEDRKVKNSTIIHAETMAILNAAKEGCPTNGHAMTVPWATCPPCALDIVSAGLKYVYFHRDIVLRTAEMKSLGSVWMEPIRDGLDILRQSGVTVRAWTGQVFPDKDFLHTSGGQDWRP